jgi:hypothetical protein
VDQRKNLSLVKVTLETDITKESGLRVPVKMTLFLSRSILFTGHLAPFILITKGSCIILQLLLEEVSGTM